MVEVDDPQVQIHEGGVGEAPEVDAAGALKVVAFRFADGAGELRPADTTYALCLEGDGAGNLRIAAELRSVPCFGVGGNDQVIVFLIPGIEARCAPRPALADGGDAQHMVTPEQRLYSFVGFCSFHRNVSMVKPASVSTLSITVMTRSSIVCGRL